MPKPFDVDKAVAEFKVIMAKIGAAGSAAERKLLKAEAKRMRAVWKEWNGDDELFEVAFGYPEEG